MFLSYKKICVVIALAISSTGIVVAKDKEKDQEKVQEKVQEVKEDAGQEIYTPTLQKDASEIFTCRVVNTGKQPQYFDIAILSSEGKPLETQAAATLPSGFTSSDSTKTKNTIAYCRVRVKSSSKNMLVTLCSQSTTSSSCKAVVTGQYSTGD